MKTQSVGMLAVVPETMVPHVKKVLAGEYALPGWVDLGEVRSVLDIGANVGAFTAWAWKQWPSADMKAYEPMPETYEMLRRNLKGDLDTVLAYKLAVWSRSGDLEMYRGLNNCGEASAIDDLGEQGEETVTVRAIRAADVISADVVKIDAEGAEVVILDGLDLGETKAVLLEWHGVNRRAAVEIMLVGEGFVRVREAAELEDRGIDIYVAEEYAKARPLVPLPTVKAEKPRVFVGMPVYGGYHAHFVPCLTALVQSPPCRLTLAPLAGDSLVSRARNRLAAAFLDSDCTHLLFLDTDLVFSPDHIARLISHGEPVVAGLYPKKQAALGWVCNVLDAADGGPGVPDERDLHAVKYAGTGCLLIAREVFEEMQAAYPELAYQPDDGEATGEFWDFFSVGVWECPRTGRRRYLSEDWWFCQRARDLGYSIWMDTGVVLKHCGEAVYPLGEIGTRNAERGMEEGETEQG